MKSLKSRDELTRSMAEYFNVMDTLEGLCDKAKERLNATIHEQIFEALYKAARIHDCTSPIEQMYYAEYLCYVRDRESYERFSQECFGHADAMMFLWDHSLKFPTVTGPITPDFLAFWRIPGDNKYYPIIVELDGHEFHQKTKQQVERDYERNRIIQGAGFQVIRFTGSEVYRNPRKCLEKTYEMAVNSTAMTYADFNKYKV